MKRKWITKLDLCVLLFLAVAVLVLFGVLFSKTTGELVSVYVDNELRAAFPLIDAPETYTVSTARGSITLRFEADGISVAATDCPDRICQRTGKIARKGESIVCAPLGVCVTLGESDYDGVTG